MYADSLQVVKYVSEWNVERPSFTLGEEIVIETVPICIVDNKWEQGYNGPEYFGVFTIQPVEAPAPGACELMVRLIGLVSQVPSALIRLEALPGNEFTRDYEFFINLNRQLRNPKKPARLEQLVLKPYVSRSGKTVDGFTATTEVTQVSFKEKWRFNL